MSQSIPDTSFPDEALQELLLTVRRITECRDYSTRLPISTHAGLGAVSTALNGLLAQVEEQHRELKASETRHRKLFEHSPMAMWVYDKQSLRFLAVNDAAVAMYGFTAEEFLARTILEIRPPEEAPKLLAELARPHPDMELGEIWIHQHKSGLRMHVEVNTHEMNFDGRPARLVVANNVSGRVRAQEESDRLNQQLLDASRQAVLTEQALRLSEERFTKAFRSGPIPMVLLMLNDSIVLDANTQFLSMVGFKGAEEILGRNAETLGILPADANWGEVQASLEGGKGIRGLKLKLNTTTGKTLEIVLWAEPLNLGLEPCALIILEDATERLRMEDQFRQSQRMEAVGQLASGVAHDFNNILTVIQGYVSLLERSPDRTAADAQSLSQVAEAARRAAALTRQLLTFSRKQIIQPRALDLNELTRGVGTLLERLIGEHIQFRFSAAPSLPLVVADPGNMEQLLMNLAVNARDAMPDGGLLEISTSVVQLGPDDASRRHPDARAGEFVSVRVKDSGCGIEPQILGRIFEPFFTTKSAGKGTGLGLATVYGIVRQHEGWIEVQSNLGKGTTFEFFLPAANAQMAPAVPPVSVMPSVDPKATILVVEDEVLVRDLACRILKSRGYRILAAASGVEALKIWFESSDEIDLLFTDVVMPNGISGRKLAGQLRARRPDLKVLFTSGYNDEISEADLSSSTATRFLAKPWETEVMLKEIADILQAPAAP